MKNTARLYIFTPVFFLIFLLGDIQSQVPDPNSFGGELTEDEWSGSDYCAHDNAMQSLLAQNPELQQKQTIFEKDLRQHILQLQAGSTDHAPMLYTLPVVVHIIHDGGAENITDAQVLQGIQDLNDAFANAGYYDQGIGVDTEIEFCLAQRDPAGNLTTGITRDQNSLTDMVMENDDIALKDINRWNPEDYINIWLVRSVTSASSGPGVAGYAFFPTSHGGPEDGIVQESEYFGSTQGNSAVQIHEMGHYLGLYHTFQGSCTNNDCTLDGDRVCDTPPDQSTAPVPCNSMPNTCNTDALSGFPSDQVDMFWNYMDYSDFNCYSAFTQGQTDRMHFSITDVRSSLLDSDGCTLPCNDITEAIFSASGTTVAAGETVFFTNSSTNAQTYDWHLDGVSFSMATDASYTFSSTGTFEVTLYSYNSNPNCIGTLSMTITVTCPTVASFTGGSSVIQIGETLNFINTSSSANSYEWLLNGVNQGTTTDFSYTFASSGTYTVCLDAIGTYCDDNNCMNIFVVDPGSCPPPCIEICDNGIDDDNDGYVDCYDDECPCNTDVCSVTDIDQNFAVKLAWQTPIDEVYPNCSPIVANLNPQVDSMPEIIVLKSGGFFSSPIPSVLIFKGDGSNANNPVVQPISQDISATWPNMPVVGDVDNDGVPDMIVVTSDQRIRMYSFYDETANPPMQEIVVSTDFVDGEFNKPMLADFNGDGISEVYAGDDVFLFDFSQNPPTLTKELSGGSSYGQQYFANLYWDACSPVAVDVLDPSHCGGDPDCNGLELAAGNIIYSVDLTTSDGDGYEIKIQRDLNSMQTQYNFVDGYTAAADVDLDGVLDLLVSSGHGTAGGSSGVYVWNRNGLVQWFPHPSFTTNTGGVPCVANVYDDTQNGAAIDMPEIILCSAGSINCYNINAEAMGQPDNAWWTLSTTDNSGATGATVFDFNGDGIEEIVYRDEDNLRVMYGGAAPYPPGVDFERNWDTFVCGAGTADEHPIVADVDNDKQAEIVVTGFLGLWVGFQGEGRVKIFEADLTAGSPWMSARPLWNQYNYFAVNINDDLSLPVQQQLHHLEFPGPGSGFRPFNRFLAQNALLDNNFQAFLPVMDATGIVESAVCAADSIEVSLSICNEGDALMPAGMPVAFYLDDPTVTATALFHTAYLGADVAAGNCLDLTTNLPSANGTVYVVMNDDGSMATPYNFGNDFPVTSSPECTYLNNLTSFDFNYSPQAAPDLGPDLSFCNNGTASLDAGSGWSSYQWQDGFPEQIYTAWEAGTYWVQVTDDCGGVLSDTIVIEMDTSLQFDLGPDTLFCPGETLTLSVPGFDEYEWVPDYAIDCMDCPTVNVTPLTDTTYTLVATDANGCLSLDSIAIEVGGAYAIYDTVQACQGDSVLIFGNYETAPGEYLSTLPNLNGCDTILSVTLEQLPNILAFDTIQICQGDSILIAGNYVSQSGIYLDTLLNNAGCDTVNTITVVVQSFIETFENTAICQGDSALIFGTYTSVPGNYVDTLLSLTDCDTIATITLQVDPLPTALQSLQICDGDSILIFGNYESQSGQFTGLAPNANGCDTILTIDLQVTPPISLSLDAEDSCPDESTGSVSATVTNGIQPFDYQWSNNESTSEIIDLDAGPFSLTLTDAIGCTATANTNVGTVATSLVGTAVEDVTCFGYSDGTLTISGFEPGSLFSIDGLFFSADTVFQNIPAGNFTLYIQSSNECIVQQEFVVAQPPQLTVTLPPDVTIELGDSIILASQVNNFDTLDYVWEPSEWLDCDDCPRPWATPFETISYTVTVMDDEGCLGEDDIQIFVRRTVNVYVPNGFSPNGDGINDVFTIFAGTGVASVKRLLVFDRWGEQVFEHYNFPPNDPTFGWDGMFKDEMMQAAVFVWFAEIEMVDGRVEMLEGDVTLVR